ncbi:MAG: MFS transporter, partial [Candidatus Omnitrophica bacterium]|nr:MFS transporter [Candidatus Omnitrophota bacterium]
MTLASDRPPSQLFLIGAGWWLTLLTVADLFLVPPLLPDFLHLVKIDISQAGWIAASYQAGAAAMTLAAGSLVDRFGCRHILAASMLLFSIGEALSGISNSMTRLLLGRFLVGAGSAAASLGLIALVGRQVSYQSRGVVLGWIGTAYFAGVTFGPLISTYIVHQTSLSWLLLLFSFLGFLSIGVSLVSFSELAPGSGKSQPAFSDILKNPGFWGLAIFQML